MFLHGRTTTSAQMAWPKSENETFRAVLHCKADPHSELPQICELS